MTESTFPTGIAVDDPPDVPSTASGAAEPMQPRERMVLLDVLRGFALLGILQVNYHSNVSSGALTDVLWFVADGSFYPTFSFLFGLGFAIQLIRAEETKRRFILRFMWRTLILFFIGVVHYVFFRASDILIEYALIAGVLLLVRRWRPSLLVALAAASLVFYMSPRLAPEWSLLTRPDPEQVEVVRVDTQLSWATAQANPPAWCQIPGLPDTYRTEVCGNAVRIRRLVTQELATVQWWKGEADVLCMFLLGLYAGRRRILRDAAQHTRLLSWVAGAGLAFGLVGNALDVFGDFFAGMGIALPKSLNEWRLAFSLGNIGLSLFYLSGITLLFTHWDRAKRVLAPLANVGRMGLTNFFMQPLIFKALGYRGFGITIFSEGGVEGWASLLLFLLINSFFVVQILYSRWWFQHFRIGPLEWAWRSLTWFRIQPMLLRRNADE